MRPKKTWDYGLGKWVPYVPDDEIKPKYPKAHKEPEKEPELPAWYAEEVKLHELLNPDSRAITAHDYQYLNLIPRIECADGLTLSVQASGAAYCTPRANFPQNETRTWTHVEVGIPSRVVEELLEFAEDKNDPTDTVYPYVPIGLVAYIIYKHGGFKK